MKNMQDRRLTFPQRNWLLLCLFTAMLTVLVYYLVDSNNRNNSRFNQIETTNSSSSITGDTQNTQGIPPDSLKH
jgi:hypothetical protein